MNLQKNNNTLQRENRERSSFIRIFVLSLPAYAVAPGTNIHSLTMKKADITSAWYTTKGRNDCYSKVSATPSR